MSDCIYLDHHTATPCSIEAIDLFSRLSKEYWSCSESYHYMGQKGVYSLQKSVQQLFDVMGARETDHLFCFSIEEALTRIALHVYTQVAKETGKTGVLTLQGADRTFAEMAKTMADLGCTHRPLVCNEKGQLTPKLVEAAITSRTAILSLSWADPLTGVIHPIEDIAALCQEKGVLLHVDASYIWGKRFFRLQDIPIDFLTLDAGAIQGIPKTGLLWTKERGLSYFKEKIPSVAEIATLNFSIEERQNKFEHYCLEVARLRDRLEEGVLKQCNGAMVLFKDVNRLPNCTVISFPGIHYEALAYLLNAKGVYGSFGGGKFPYLVEQLSLLGIDDSIVTSALSFSFSCDMTEEMVDRAILEIAASVKQLQKYCMEEGLCKKI